MNRNLKGQFIVTNNSQKYKRIERGGKNLLLHRYVWEQAKGIIPENMVIHHINGNKKDNRLENLALMSYLQHNRIHAHQAWNKDKKCPKISLAKMGHPVFKSQIKKAKDSWTKKQQGLFMQIMILKHTGYNFKQISILLKKDTSNIYRCYNKYKEVFNYDY